MNKKLMALAVAGALAVPAGAFAQASSVQIYGRLNLGVDNYSATGATAGSAADFKSRARIYDSGSRLGFRGSEDLGGGLKAIFQMESGVNVDTGNNLGQSTAANGSTGFLASRDSFVGLEGGWGRVKFGRQSLFWSNGAIAQTGGNYISAEIPWISHHGGMGRVAGINSRQSNVTMYDSPNWGSFNFSAFYAPNSEAAAANADTDARLWGVTLRYTGLLRVLYDHAEDQAASGGANRRKIVGDKLGLGWPYAPGAQISLVWVRNQNRDAATVASFSALHDNIAQSAWGLNWEHSIGNVQVLAIWSKLQKASGCGALNGGANGCDETDATGYTLGARYNLSKRTAAYVSWNAIRNSANQIADYTGSGMSSAPGGGPLPAASAGANPRIWSMGVWHQF